MGEPTFTVTISGSWRLSVRDIWPEGYEAPENPTVEDVRAAMPDRVSELVRDWDMEPEVGVYAT